MKIGVLCEGEYTDQVVLKKLLGHLFPEVEFAIRGVSKQVIFKLADVELATMFDKGVDRALIVWDLLPTGLQMGVPSQWSEEARRVEQRHMLLKLLCESTCLPETLVKQAQHLARRYSFSYANNDVEHPNSGDDLFRLACICYTLDGLLLADAGVLRDLASTDTRAAERLGTPVPDQCRNPSATLKKYFGQSPNKRIRYYNKIDHNVMITEAYIKQGKVDAFRASLSFCRIADSIHSWISQ